MREYIDRNALLKTIHENPAEAHNERCAQLLEAILNAPTADVIELPCKVGQTVYCIRYDKARKPFVKPLGVLSVTIYGKGGFTVFTTKEDTLGKTVFLTCEEAEKALAERSENGT